MISMPGVEVAALGRGHALEAHGPRAQVRALGAHRLLARQAGDLGRLGVPAGGLQVPRADEPLRRGLARQAVGRVRLGGDAPRGQRALPVALQGVDAGDPPLGVGQRAPRPGGQARGDHLALRARRLAELARELGVGGVALDRRRAGRRGARPRATGRAPGAPSRAASR